MYEWCVTEAILESCLVFGRASSLTFIYSGLNCIYIYILLLYFYNSFIVHVYVFNLMILVQCFISVLTHQLITFSELIWECLIHLLVNITI